MSNVHLHDTCPYTSMERQIMPLWKYERDSQQLNYANQGTPNSWQSLTPLFV